MLTIRQLRTADVDNGPLTSTPSTAEPTGYSGDWNSQAISDKYNNKDNVQDKESFEGWATIHPRLKELMKQIRRPMMGV